MRITPDRVIPALQWGRQYDRSKLVSDLLAAVIATVMLIPQSLAYAMLAGLPPEVGLYARANGVAAGAASRAVEQAIQPVNQGCGRRDFRGAWGRAMSALREFASEAAGTICAALAAAETPQQLDQLARILRQGYGKARSARPTRRPWAT